MQTFVAVKSVVGNQNEVPETFLVYTFHFIYMCLFTRTELMSFLRSTALLFK